MKRIYISYIHMGHSSQPEHTYVSQWLFSVFGSINMDTSLWWILTRFDIFLFEIYNNPDLLVPDPTGSSLWLQDPSKSGYPHFCSSKCGSQTHKNGSNGIENNKAARSDNCPAKIIFLLYQSLVILSLGSHKSWTVYDDYSKEAKNVDPGSTNL